MHWLLGPKLALSSIFFFITMFRIVYSQRRMGHVVPSLREDDCPTLFDVHAAGMGVPYLLYRTIGPANGFVQVTAIGVCSLGMGDGLTPLFYFP